MSARVADESLCTGDCWADGLNALVVDAHKSIIARQRRRADHTFAALHLANTICRCTLRTGSARHAVPGFYIADERQAVIESRAGRAVGNALALAAHQAGTACAARAGTPVAAAFLVGTVGDACSIGV